MLKSALLSLCLLLAGCGATVYPQASPPRPVAVYIADYGIHSSLLLPTGNGRFVEYAFGDWNFAALNHCWPQDAIGALLISFQSALGRRFIDVKPGQTEPRPDKPPPHHLHVVYASQQAVDEVVHTLDERFRRDSSETRYNPENGMTFVKDPEHYSIANSCNHLTARLLRQLGCRVDGLVVLSSFDVVPPPPSAVAVQSHHPTPATMPTAGAN